jgi:hypothetical protein
MTIKRLRKLPSNKKLEKMYAEPHDHRLYGHGHHLRVEQSIVFVRWISEWQNLNSVADLSCGNGGIALALNMGNENTHLGDFAQGYEYVGPIEENVNKIPDIDLYICSETLEHLDNPQEVLLNIRKRSKWLFLTTPIENWGDANTEHLWSWDRKGVEELLKEASFTPRMFGTLDSTVINEPYVYGMWVCS